MLQAMCCNTPLRCHGLVTKTLFDRPWNYFCNQISSLGCVVFSLVIPSDSCTSNQRFSATTSRLSTQVWKVHSHFAHFVYLDWKATCFCTCFPFTQWSFSFHMNLHQQEISFFCLKIMYFDVFCCHYMSNFFIQPWVVLSYLCSFSRLCMVVHLFALHPQCCFNPPFDRIHIRVLLLKTS